MSDDGRYIVAGNFAPATAVIVIGLVQLGVAAGGVLVLLFIAVLLASALEPIVGTLRERLPLGRRSRAAAARANRGSSRK